ncbi:MAG: sigma-70 family RNA polymerase sigma factor [Bacteroidota bacterium]
MTEPAMQTLIESIKKGDNSALEAIFKQHQRYCIDKLVIEKKCVREEAEDIYVESVMNFREKVLSGKLTEISSIKYYLSQTCVNMFYTRIKQKQRWDRNVDDVQRFFYESEYLIDPSDYNFDKAIEVTRKAWASLKEKCKDIIHYFYVDKLRMEEIAEIMGFSSADVAKTTKARCYKKMMEEAARSM